ncbi:hypothetical protein MTO96_026789 [Rhipicephalus appendiculatus]
MVFEGYRRGLALFDIDKDGDLECLSTVQEDYDESVPSVTYVWLLKGVNGHEAKNISYYVRPGHAPDEFMFKDKNDNKPLQTGRYIYSDYKDCLLLEMPYGSSQGKAKHQLQREIPDAAKVFAGFRSGLALFDIDNDGDLDCVSTVQEDYDESVPSATYMWLLKGMNGHEARNETYLVIPGAKHGEFLFKDIDSDGPLKTGYYDYTDYKTCVVMRMPYRSYEECVLWVTEEVKDDIPQNCKDYFEDNCENAKLSYDKKICSGVEI